MRRLLALLAVVCLALVVAIPACRSTGKDTPAQAALSPSTAHGPGGPPIVVGTTLDAESGRPLPDVLIQAPDGTQVRSDDMGRFELRGLPLGAAGPLLASDDARSGRVELRPLAPGRLEVVLFLRD